MFTGKVKSFAIKGAINKKFFKILLTKQYYMVYNIVENTVKR